jgi:N utilization substance protein B
VLQTLFEWDFLSAQAGLSTEKEGDNFKGGEGKDTIQNVLNRNLKEFAPGFEDDAFVFSLLERVIKKRVTIDEIIEKAAPDWPLDKISIVDRNILRIGLTELLFGDRKEVPPKVAINEAIELAKTFGGENSSKFVNGVLGAVYKEIGEPGKEQISRKKNPHEPVDISTLPIDKKGGALVYAVKDGNILFALVHDVFGYWTLSKGSISDDENEEAGTIREVQKEIGLDNLQVEEKLGENQYVATHPEKGKRLKKVVYFLAKSDYKELELEETGGLDAARWFELGAIPELRIYNDIIPLISKAIEIITKKS